MKRVAIFWLSLILSIITLFIIAYKVEKGDINSVSMYLIVFIIPIIVIAILNYFFIKLIYYMNGNAILGLIPIVTLVSLAFIKKLTIPFIDGNLSIVMLVGAISIGITNTIWILTSTKR